MLSVGSDPSSMNGFMKEAHACRWVVAIVQCCPALHHDVLYLHLPTVLQILHVSMND